MEGSSETDCLDHELRQEMQKLVEQLTTSGKPILNAETMKKFKNICKYVNLPHLRVHFLFINTV